MSWKEEEREVENTLKISISKREKDMLLDFQRALEWKYSQLWSEKNKNVKPAKWRFEYAMPQNWRTDWSIDMGRAGTRTLDHIALVNKHDGREWTVPDLGESECKTRQPLSAGPLATRLLFLKRLWNEGGWIWIHGSLDDLVIENPEKLVLEWTITGEKRQCTSRGCFDRISP